MLPDDGPAEPKHVGVIFKINFNMRSSFYNVKDFKTIHWCK